MPLKASSVYRALNDLAYDRTEGGGIPFSSRYMYMQFINVSQPDEYLNLLNIGDETLKEVSQRWQKHFEKEQKRFNNGRHKHN